VIAHDPVAVENARCVLDEGVHFVEDCYEAANDADAIVVATDWNEYKQMDFRVVRKLMSGNVVVDARNIYDPLRIVSVGLQYLGVGRRVKETIVLEGSRQPLKVTV
jgi:UDPglucose 6-dehydrogenase